MPLIRLQQINANKKSLSVVLRFGNTTNKTYKVGDSLGLFRIVEISRDLNFNYDGSTEDSFIVIAHGTVKYKIPYKGEFRIERDSDKVEIENSYFDAHKHLKKEIVRV